jgi:hypothetical protein
VKRGFFVALVAVTALAGSGCASSGVDGSSDQMEGTVPGAAADPAEALARVQCAGPFPLDRLLGLSIGSAIKVAC